jgi:nitrite reductase (NADH) large subunit
MSTDPHVRTVPDPGSDDGAAPAEPYESIRMNFAHAPARGRERLVIIGNGMVSHRLCETLIALAPDRYDITILSEEQRPAYDRVHLGEMLCGRDPDSLLLKPFRWYLEHGIDLRLGDPVVGLDLARRFVRSAHGVEVRYDKLVLATGSVARMAPIKIDDWTGILSLRTIDDVERVRAACTTATRAAVIGGGLLGLETASTLRAGGLEVTVIERGERLMGRHLDPEASALLKQRLEAMGLVVHLATEVPAILGGTSGKRVVLADGTEILVDFVVIATGARPRDNLAIWGLETHPDGGYRVNDLLQTTDPRVFALGECAAFEGTSFGTVSPGYAMADCLARTLVRRPTRFHTPTPTVRLKIAGLPVAVAGSAPSEMTPRVVAAASGAYRSLHLDGRHIVHATAVGRWDEWEEVEDAVRRRRAIGPAAVERFTRGESLFPRASRRSGQLVVCSCNNVTRQAIDCAIAAGCKTVAQIAARTHATTTCGGCLPKVLQALDPSAVAPADRRVPMVLAGVASLLAVVAVACSRAALARWWPHALAFWDHLWRQPLDQQITGFSLLGLLVVALGLPLRKQVQWIPGSTATWRLVHGAVGLLILAAIVVHTGLRLGINLNRLLSVAFLELALFGGLAAVVPAATQRQARWARALRWLHVKLFWPGLALLGLHVLAVYYF